MRLQRKDFVGLVFAMGTMITVYAHADDAHQKSHLPLIVDAGGATTMTKAIETVALVGFDVLPMTGDGLLRDQVVIIRGGLIQRIGRVGVVEVPENARTIERSGSGVLVPGMTDAHVHIPDAREDFLPLFLANGVTTVFNLEGDPRHVALKYRAQAQDFVGPRIFTSGPFLNDRNVRTPKEAREMVAQHVEAGYDFLKIHGQLSESAYAALTIAAREARIPAIGHAPRNLPFSAVLEHRQAGIVHAEELIYTGLQTLDPRQAARVAEEMARAGAWLTPTMSTFESITEQWASKDGLDARLARPGAEWLPKQLRQDWASSDLYVGRPVRERAEIEARNAFHEPLVGAMHFAGVPILTGTDTPLPGLVPGFSIHDELSELVGAGLTPEAALVAATRNAGLFVGEHTSGEAPVFGVLKPGAAADLVWVQEDPRDNLNTMREPMGVMVRGAWYDRAALRAMLVSVSTPRIADR